MEKVIDLDNAATTATRKEVVEAMLPYFTEKFANASAIYSIGAQNKQAIDEARQSVADVIGAKAD